MRYESFELRIEAGPGGLLTAVVAGLDGEPRGVIDPSRLPWPPYRSGGDGRTAGRPVVALSSEEAHETPREAEEVGRQLFEAVFSDSVRSALDVSLGRIGDDEAVGLRLRIHLDPSLPEIAHLQTLPWELLYYPERGFLATSQGRRISIVRYLPVQRPPKRPLAPPPATVLLVLGEPTSAAGTLDLAREQTAIERALSRLPDVHLQVLRQPTLEELRDALLDHSPTIVHYMGHGELDPETGGGLLLRGPRPTGASELGRQLPDRTKLQLVVLNACDTGRPGHRETFSGVAPALVKAGVPAVVGMRAAIGDQPAIRFAERFYGRIAAGEPVDAAVAEGRVALVDLPGDDRESWSLPVLFLRAEDGRVVAPPAVEPPARSPVGRLLVGAAALLLLVALVRWLPLGPTAAPGEPAAALGALDGAATSSAVTEPPPPGGDPPAEEPLEVPAEPVLEEATTADRQPEERATNVPTTTAPVEPPVRAPATYLVADGEAVALPGLGHVTVDFLSEYGTTFVRLTLSATGADRPGREAVLASGPVVFDGLPGEPVVRVVSIDWATRRVRLAPADG